MIRSLVRPIFSIVFLVLALSGFAGWHVRAQTNLAHVPPRRSSQIKDGFGINSDLPRDPFLPSDRWWWTRMFDAGINFIRIGQYENSSDYTSWEWIERRRGEYSIEPVVDDYVNSLRENGVHIELQLLYGNPLYTSPAGRLPNVITPEFGGFHNPDRSLYSVFWPPTTDEQIEAFTRYVTWMVNRFHGRIEYYEVWNEPNIDYWNPVANPEAYGRLFKAAAAAIHAADPQAKAVFGGLAGAEVSFAKRALDACNCAAAIDVFAYHNYPGYGHNLNPEAASKNNDTNLASKPLRDMVRAYPGMKKDLVFWDDEFNDGIPSWKDCDESVQAKYVPRGLLIDRAEGVRTFVWLIAGATDGNEFDDFGMLHGLRYRPDDFSPRRVYSALQNTYTLFSDTRLDNSIALDWQSNPSVQPRSYAFRSATGKVIVAYWLPVLSKPGNDPHETATVRVAGSGIQHPVLIDIGSGEVKDIAWAAGTNDTVRQLPVSDSVMAIADRSYFDWSVLPEGPSNLEVSAAGSERHLSWAVHGSRSDTISVERRSEFRGQWQEATKLPGTATSFVDRTGMSSGTRVFYRVRALNTAGASAYSNVAGLQIQR